MPRTRITRLRSATSAALLALTLAAPALADHDDWRNSGDYGSRPGYPVYEHDRHCDRDDHGDPRHGEWERGGRGDFGYYGDGRGSGDRGWDRRNERHFGDVYACRPCGRRFGARRSFYRHLQAHHGVPFWAIPRVVVGFDWGWLFRG